jgi:hypothetical protein
MESEHTISGLVRKRAELAGQLEYHHGIVRQLMVDLDHLDATLRMFDPEIKLDDIKPKALPARYAASQGEMARIVLTILKDAREPLASEQLTQRVMAERGMNMDDKRLLRTVRNRVGSCLRHHRAKGVLRSEQGPGQQLTWELVR